MYSMRLNTEEERLFKSYSKLHGISVSEALKRALIEKIEDEFDAAVAEEAYQEYLDSGMESKPISELWKELDL